MILCVLAHKLVIERSFAERLEKYRGIEARIHESEMLEQKKS